MKTLGEVIRELRKARGWTQEELAHRVGSDAGNISRLERGIQGASESTLRAIAKAFDLRLSDLYGIAEEGHSIALDMQIARGTAGEETISSLLKTLAKRFDRGDPAVREEVARLVLRYLENPQAGERIAKAIETLLGGEDGSK